MVAHLGLPTHELLYEEISNIIAEIVSAWEQAKWYKELAIHSKRFFTLIQITTKLWFSLEKWLFWF